MERVSNGSSSERIMRFSPPPQPGEMPRDIVARNVEDLVREHIYVSPDYVAGFWGEESAERYSQILAEQRRQNWVDNMNA